MPSSRLAYRVHGLHCAEEIRALRSALEPQPGVEDLEFDLVAERMVLRIDASRITPERIVEAVGRAGLRAEPWRDEVGGGPSGRAQAWAAAASGALLAAGFAVRAFESGSLRDALLQHGTHGLSSGPVSGTLFALAAATGALAVLPRVVPALRAFRLDMTVLVLVAIAGASLLGEWSEGAMVASLFAVANLLEGWSGSKAREAVAALMRLTPHQASVLDGGVERTVPADHVRPGAVIVVRPGERVPVDGVVVGGRSEIDESAVTGDPSLRARGPADPILAGSLNGASPLEIRATRRANESAIARMVRTVERARTRRTRAERWVERFALAYTPAVLALAAAVAFVPPLLVGNFAEWFYRGLVVTLVACPCALVISTPVSIVAAVASAAREGVLVKGGECLETAARVRTVAFDKSALATRAEVDVTLVEPLDGRSADVVLALVAGLEARSEHPLGRALARAAARRRVPALALDEVRSLAGRGMEGTAQGVRYWIGNPRWLADRGLMAAPLQSRVAELEASGLTVVLCGNGDSVWGLIAVDDALRAGAADAAGALRRAGVRRIALLTGESEAAARRVATVMGADDVRWGLLPEDKADVVRELERVAHPVAMVGDSVNDTPAMASSSLGIALGPRSADTALETADVVLAFDDLGRAAWLFSHARRAVRVVKQNVALAVGAKVLFLLAAAGGYATLWMAVAADTGATLAVTVNGLRMLRPTRVRSRSGPGSSGR